MKLKSISKVFLGSAALCTGAYYLSQKKSLFNVWADENNLIKQPVDATDHKKDNLFKQRRGGDTDHNKKLSISERLELSEEDYSQWLMVAPKSNCGRYKGELQTHALTNMGSIYERLNEPNKAIDSFWEAYFIRKIELGSDHPETILLKELLEEKDPNFLKMHKMLFDKDLPPVAQEGETSSDGSVSHKQDESSVIGEKEDLSLEDGEPNIIGELNDFLHSEL